MTADDIAAEIGKAREIAGEKFQVFTKYPAKKEGLYIRPEGNGYFSLRFLSAVGEPMRIPVAVRGIIGLAMPKLSVGTNWKNVGSLDYANSNDTQRRVDTFRSILTSVLSDAEAVDTKGGGTPGCVKVECWGGTFPVKPKLADVQALSSTHTEGLPTGTTWVRLRPKPPTRTITLSEAPVGPNNMRADHVSISYRLSKEELKLVKAGKGLSEIPETARQMINPTVHIGDINRPLSGEALAAHFSKSMKYAILVLEDLQSQLRGARFHLRGRIRISVVDSYLHSVAVLFDTVTGKLKPMRDSVSLDNSKKTQSPGEIPPDGPPKDESMRVKAHRLEIIGDLKEAKMNPDTDDYIKGEFRIVRESGSEVLSLKEALAKVGGPMSKGMADICKAIRTIAKGSKK